jgi:polysaccharide biosynthesis transport protein
MIEFPEDRVRHAVPVLGNGHNGRMPRSSVGPGAQGSQQSSEDQSLVRYWMVLRERVWVIVICTVLVFAAAVVYVKTAPKTYQAQSEMLVQAAASGDATLAALPVLHQTGDPTADVLTGASMVTTQPVAAAVVQALHLRDSPASILGDIAATPIGQASLIAVQASTSSPQLAQRLATAFVEQTIALSTARLHAAIARELPTLEGQLAAVPAAQRFGPGSLGAQVDELRQLQLQSDPTLVVAAPASLPTAPASPKTKLSLIAGLIAGLLIGVGAAFLLHALDPVLRREDQLRERFNLPILARIPRQPRSKRPRPLLPSELSFGAQEGYRTLRTTIAARSRSTKSRAMLVTGSAPAEGKSTTSLALAAALAHGEARVILIEADFRRPTFAGSLNLATSAKTNGAGFIGIEQVMTGRVELARALIPVRVDGTPLRILAASRSMGDLADKLSFALVRKLVNDAKAMADFVVIDSAPLTAVIDALPFAQAADDVLIASRLNHTRLNGLAELIDLLTQNGVAPTGVVLIGGHPGRGDYYYAAEPIGASEPRRSRAGLEPSSKGSPEN